MQEVRDLSSPMRRRESAEDSSPRRDISEAGGSFCGTEATASSLLVGGSADLVEPDELKDDACGEATSGWSRR